MDKVTSGTEPRTEAGTVIPSVESMLNSRAFRERLEKARRQREQALAEMCDAVPKTILAGTRPWEQADPEAISRRRALADPDATGGDRPAAGASNRPHAGRDEGRAAAPATSPVGPQAGRPQAGLHAGPRPGFAGLAAVTAAPSEAAAGGAAPAAPAPAPAPAQAPAPAAPAITLHPASKAAVGATMARAAAAMAARFEAGQMQGEGGSRTRGAFRLRPAALPPAIATADDGTGAARGGARRNRVLLAAGGFALGLSMGAALAWVFARPATVAVPVSGTVRAPQSTATVPARPLARPPVRPAGAAADTAADTADAVSPASSGTAIALDAIVDVVARAPALGRPSGEAADAGPTAPADLARPDLRPAYSVLPPAGAPAVPGPGLWLHAPDRLAIAAAAGPPSPALSVVPGLRLAGLPALSDPRPPQGRPPGRLRAAPRPAAPLAERPPLPLLPGGSAPAPRPAQAPLVLAAPAPDAAVVTGLADGAGAARATGSRALPALAPRLPLPAPSSATATAVPRPEGLPPAPRVGAAPAGLAGTGAPSAPVVTALAPGREAQSGRDVAVTAPLLPSGAMVRPDDLPRRLPPLLPAPPAPALAGYSVHIQAPNAVGDDALGRIAADLAGLGFAPNPPARVGFSVRETHVRFYHAADAGAAAALAERAGARVRDFTTFRPSPPGGTLELWLQGGGRGGAKAAGPARARAPADPLAARKRALRDLLVEQLRRGDHL